MTNSDHRHGEAPEHHTRSERAIQIDGEWFFSTREGLKVGPYTTREDAESAAADLRNMLEHITDPEATRQFVIREFMLAKWARVRGKLKRK